MAEPQRQSWWEGFVVGVAATCLMVFIITRVLVWTLGTCS